MYLKAFDGKRNRATIQRGYSLIQLLVVMLLVSILATADIRPRPLQNSFSPDSRNLNTGFRLFLFQISTDSTQIPP